MGGVPTTATEPSLFGSTGSSSAAAAPTAVQAGDGTSFNYLIATVANSGNSTNGTTITTQPQTNPGGGSGANTGLAMIILYAITGCVTLLFLIVIMSGAIRAMRHPERYGPRARTSRPGDNGQSRIGGLSQAILDTFPVVKFLSGQNKNQNNTGRRSEETTDEEGPKDIETGIEDIDASGRRNSVTAASVPMVVMGASRPSIPTRDSDIVEATQGTGEGSDRPRSYVQEVPPDTEDTSAIAPAAATTEESHTHDDEQVDTSVTCPICLVDFEDGDDLRVLPCDSRHQFHDAVSCFPTQSQFSDSLTLSRLQCVVPWLLNVSSLCPLCRLDLAKDREAAGGEAEPAAEASERPANRPRASSVLATSFRQLLPTTGGHRASRQAGPSTTAATGSTPDAALETGELGQLQGEDGQQGAGQGGATRSRWMRYVEQRRQRVRARTLTRSTGQPGPSAPPAPPAV